MLIYTSYSQDKTTNMFIVYNMDSNHKNHLSTPLLLFFFLLFTTSARSADPAAFSCGGANSTARVSDNINKLLPVLVSRTIQSRFVTTTSGENKDKVYGLAQCRGDVPDDECNTCIQDAAKVVRDSDHCPTQSEAKIWYDFCFLRYSTSKFVGGVDTTGWYLYNVEYATGIAGYNETVGNLMNNVSKVAVQKGKQGLGKGTRKLSDFVTLYGLVQCTRDLSDLGCAQCLARAIDFPEFCIGKKGCRVLFGSCYVRFELYPFFYPLDVSSSSVRSGRFVGVKT